MVWKKVTIMRPCKFWFWIISSIALQMLLLALGLKRGLRHLFSYYQNFIPIFRWLKTRTQWQPTQVNLKTLRFDYNWQSINCYFKWLQNGILKKAFRPTSRQVQAKALSNLSGMQILNYNTGINMTYRDCEKVKMSNRLVFVDIKSATTDVSLPQSLNYYNYHKLLSRINLFKLLRTLYFKVFCSLQINKEFYTKVFRKNLQSKKGLITNISTNKSYNDRYYNRLFDISEFEFGIDFRFKLIFPTLRAPSPILFTLLT